MHSLPASRAPNNTLFCGLISSSMSALANAIAAIDNLGAIPPLTADDEWRSLSACIVAVLACLKHKPSTPQQPDDSASVQNLCDYVGRIISPCPNADADDDVPEYEQVAQRSREIAIYGLSILQILNAEHSAKFSLDTLLTVISFTNPTLTDPWTTQEACGVAQSLLSEQLLHHFNQPVLLETILKDYLRPAFSKSRPKAVTASGRKSEFPEEDDPHRGLSDDTKEVKPWKYADHRAITVFHWVVLTTGPDFISKQWPLFIPVLLALLDDGTTRVRKHGLLILDAFLARFPANILRDTGLTSVFEDAVFPTLHFLPSITPEEESIILLEAAYTALLSLASKTDTRAGKSEPYGGSPKAKLLDKMLRDGVFSAYFHVKDHVRIVEVLLMQTAKIVDEMRIHSVKHLKDLIPMHTEVMTNPFAALAPSTLSAAIEGLQALIANCWPRLSTPAYQDELIKALVVCYLTVHDEQDQLGTRFAAIDADLVKTASMLTVATRGAGGEAVDDLGDKAAMLIAKEPLLAELFK
ncbi:hypothetical protein J7T55_010239 [Diaporthe amygdali]|uniref:uncharacterized protein n=1 Tax=Phomopsis amygdali TaxID=1214568 RepID=UPI0022FDD4E2|nr:uncharacterized protein J7T55_010239 [Diaporthe amygdali]KAJ0113995.1 hypothetical protein J7T55_010239 [Diaporthe amygdali]